MRIAIVALGHSGSVLPLAKTFVEKGHVIDCYILCEHSIKNIEAFDLNISTPIFGTRQLKKSNCKSLFNYFDYSTKFKLYLSANSNIFSHVPFINKFVNLKSGYIRFARLLNKRNYDCINFVGRYEQDLIVDLLEVCNTRTIVSLHEVCNHENANYTKPSRLLSYLFSNKISIVVHSSNCFNDILKYKECRKECVSIIPFGTFDTFSVIPEDSNIVLPQKYLLYIGLISPYKGLNVLYDAINKVELNGYKIIVAGKGYDDVLEKIIADSRFIYIPGFLSNQTFITLIKRSKYVICPYLSMSQSGIPQSSFVFNIPIIASNLDGFIGIIEDGKTGFLFDKGNSEDLAKIIEKVISDESLHDKFVDTINKWKYTSSDYSWSAICDKYLKIIFDKVNNN